jgi:AraC-like DNA-binding protein
LLSLLHASEARPFPLQPYDQNLLDQCIAEIVRENEERSVGFASLVQSLLLRLIALCLRATQRASGFGRHFRHTTWRYRVLTEQVLAMIREEAIREPELTLAEIAKRCGTSGNHLNRIVRQQTGSTVHQLLLRQRLELAKALLEKGEVNCTEAAFASGFHDSNYFSRAFRKVFGYSPSELGRR